jgi:uncharacterized OB-fold protein
MNTPKKPVPVVNPWARPFWEAARDHKLVIQKCKDCDKYVFYPRIACPHCFSDEVTWVQASGKGKIYTYSVVVSNAPSAFVQDMPYVIAVIRLDEGVQMLSNVVECKPEDVRCDMPVEVTFEKLDEQFTLPKFKPIKK